MIEPLETSASVRSSRCPVLVLGFNRPDKVRAVLREVKLFEPSVLYFAVDGPRSAGESARVQEVRDVIGEFEWNCRVVTLFHEQNLGARHAMQQSLDSMFKEQPAGIILEDDCLPSHDFFRFCVAALAKYENSPTVGMVSGTNFLTRFDLGKYDAIFSDGHIWGWATWADRWQAYREMPSEDESGGSARKYYGAGWPYRRRLISQASQGKLDAWDIPWLLHLAHSGQWAAIPVRNLVTNVGHGPGGTHTTGNSRFANLKLRRLRDELRFPENVRPSRAYQTVYALSLRFEDRVHRLRRPIVQLARNWFHLARR